MPQARIKKHAKGKPPANKHAWPQTDRLQQAASWRYTGIVLGALYLIVASLITFRYHRILDFGMESDFLFEFVPLAKSLAEGTLEVGPYRGPVYPILLQAGKVITGDYFTAGLIIGLLAATGTLIVTFSLIRRLFTPEIGLAVGLLLMANPYFFMYSYQLGTDMLFVAFVTSSLYFLLAGGEMNWKRLSASAVLGALAFLTRYNGIAILAVPVLILLINPGKLDWKRRSLAAALFTVVFFVSIAPWGFYSLKEKGSFLYSENQRNIAFEIYGKDQVSREDFFFRGNPFEGMSIPALIKYDPPVFFGTLARNFWQHGVYTFQYLLGWLTSILALAGLVLLLIRKMTPSQATFLLLNLAFFLALLPVHFEIRYPLFMLGALLTLAACGLLLINLNIDNRVARLISVLALIGLVLYTAANSYQINREQIGSGPAEVVAVADWFKDNVPPERRGIAVAARKPHIAYYAGLEYVPLPVASSPNELIQQLKEQKVSYLYIGRMESLNRPQLRGLLDARRSWPGLKKIATSDQPASVLYEIE
jgi:4-amino-4-deoxy-L-arabinose transferase-like glycosyltransferase